MPGDATNRAKHSRAENVLKDIHFWVPVAVLIGGLLLLKFVH